MIERKDDIELPHGARLEERAARRAGAERADLRGVRPARQRIDLDGRGLPHLKVVPIDLGDLRPDFHPSALDDVRNRTP